MMTLDTSDRFNRASKSLGLCFDGSGQPWQFPQRNDEHEKVLHVAEGERIHVFAFALVLTPVND